MSYTLHLIVGKASLYWKLKGERTMATSVKIPDMWLVGCTQTFERDGLSPKAALEAAIRVWRKQEQLEKIFKAQSHA